MARLLQFLTVLSMAAIGGCSKPAPDSTAAPEKTTARIDACTLLTDSEIESVQGEPVQDRRPSSSSPEGYFTSQCYVALPTHTKSIVITVTQSGAGSAGKDAKELWRSTFHRANGPAEKGEGEKKEKKAEPVKVDGLGDEAFWSGSAVGGALYVLKGGVHLRLSTGGSVDQLERCKRLAELALKHL